VIQLTEVPHADNGLSKKAAAHMDKLAAKPKRNNGKAITVRLDEWTSSLGVMSEI
jgi:hypothetical protein